MTGEQVKAFSHHYCKAMKVRAIEKDTFMWLVMKLTRRVTRKYAKALEKLSEKLRPMALVKFIFLTFRVGSDDLPLVEQIRIIVHEIIHCIRIRRWKEKGGKIAGWYKEYYTNPMFRAIEEAIACAGAGEVVRALLGKAPPPPDLSSYFVDEIHVQAAANVYDTHVKGNGYTMDSVREAIMILKKVGILT